VTGDRRIRAATAVVVTAVAAFAAVVSYSHIYDLGRVHGQDGTAARLLPLSVDGLILAASLVLLHEARNGRPAPGLARFALWLGVGGTIAANGAYGWPYGPVGVVLSTWPGAAFVIAVELVMLLVRRSRKPGAGLVSPASGPAPGAQVAHDAEHAARLALAASVAAGNPLSQRQLMTRFGLTRTRERKVREAVAAESNGHPAG
jgi:Protein of unknown function (DUF2637)